VPCGWAAGGCCSGRGVQRMFDTALARPGITMGFGALALALACTTDTSGLARQPSSAGSGGAGGSFSMSGGTGGQVEANGGGGSGGGAAPSTGGMGSIHFVHGLLDGGDMFVCLRDAGGASLDGDAALPEAGVAYGGSVRVPVSWDASRDVEALLFVVAGGAAGRSCSELIESSQVQLRVVDAGSSAADAGLAPPVFPLDPVVPRSAGSVRFPPGLLRAGAHYALVAAGCTGQGGNEAVCGAPDPIFGSALALALAEIGPEIVGAEGGNFGLQFLNASRALLRADVVLQGQTEREARRLAENVGFGAIRPRDSAPADEPVGVELHVEGSSSSSYTEVWANMLEAAGGTPIAPGETYLLVYIGPVPGSSAGEVAPPRFVLVRGS
jgi:hypothetical protein